MPKRKKKLTGPTVRIEFLEIYPDTAKVEIEDIDGTTVVLWCSVGTALELHPPS